MGLLDAIRHHALEGRNFAVGSGNERECRAEMLAEDQALEKRLQRVEEKAAEALTETRRLEHLRTPGTPLIVAHLEQRMERVEKAVAKLEEVARGCLAFEERLALLEQGARKVRRDVEALTVSVEGDSRR